MARNRRSSRSKGQGQGGETAPVQDNVGNLNLAPGQEVTTGQEVVAGQHMPPGQEMTTPSEPHLVQQPASGQNAGPRQRARSGGPRDGGGMGGSRLKVVSGGQTGVDRGALDAALEVNIECGGWCDDGRLAEDGTIPEQYPVKALTGGDYLDRIRKNVVDSDGTAILFFGELEGSAESSLDDCVQLGKPYKLIDGSSLQPGQAANQIAEFVRETGVCTLNVVGPRASKAERGHKFTFDAMRLALDLLKRNGQTARRSGSTSGRQRPPGQSQGFRSNGNGRGIPGEGRGGNGRGGSGEGRGSEGRGGKSRNPQFNAQKRKGSGQRRPKQGAKSPGANQG